MYPEQIPLGSPEDREVQVSNEEAVRDVSLVCEPFDPDTIFDPLVCEPVDPEMVCDPNDPDIVFDSLQVAGPRQKSSA